MKFIENFIIRNQLSKLSENLVIQILRQIYFANLHTVYVEKNAR